MVIEIVQEIHPDDLRDYLFNLKHGEFSGYKSVRVLSPREWPETGQSAYKVVRESND